MLLTLSRASYYRTRHVTSESEEFRLIDPYLRQHYATRWWLRAIYTGMQFHCYCQINLYKVDNGSPTLMVAAHEIWWGKLGKHRWGQWCFRFWNNFSYIFYVVVFVIIIDPVSMQFSNHISSKFQFLKRVFPHAISVPVLLSDLRT